MAYLLISVPYCLFTFYYLFIVRSILWIFSMWYHLASSWSYLLTWCYFFYFIYLKSWCYLLIPFWVSRLCPARVALTPGDWIVLLHSFLVFSYIVSWVPFCSSTFTYLAIQIVSWNRLPVRPLCQGQVLPTVWQWMTCSLGLCSPGSCVLRLLRRPVVGECHCQLRQVQWKRCSWNCYSVGV